MTKAAWFFAAIAICMTGRGVVLQWTINDLQAELAEIDKNDHQYTQSMLRALMSDREEATAIAQHIIRQQQKIIDQLKDDIEAMPTQGGI